MSFKVVKKGRHSNTSSIVLNENRIHLGRDILDEVNPDGKEYAQILFNEDAGEVALRFSEEALENAYKVTNNLITSRICKRLTDSKTTIDDWRFEDNMLIFKAPNK